MGNLGSQGGQGARWWRRVEAKIALRDTPSSIISDLAATSSYWARASKKTKRSWMVDITKQHKAHQNRVNSGFGRASAMGLTKTDVLQSQINQSDIIIKNSRF